MRPNLLEMRPGFAGSVTKRVALILARFGPDGIGLGIRGIMRRRSLDAKPAR